jgi:hypothetical protein
MNTNLMAEKVKFYIMYLIITNSMEGSNGIVTNIPTHSM